MLGAGGAALSAGQGQPEHRVRRELVPRATGRHGDGLCGGLAHLQEADAAEFLFYSGEAEESEV